MSFFRKTVIVAAVVTAGSCLGPSVSNAQITIGPGGVYIGPSQSPQPQYERERQRQSVESGFFFEMNRQRYGVYREFYEGRWHYRQSDGSRVPNGAQIYDRYGHPVYN